MQDICKCIVDEWDKKGYSFAEMVKKTGLSESTLRRFRSGDKGVTFDTAVTVAVAVGVTIGTVAEMLPAPAAVAVKMIEEDLNAAKDTQFPASTFERTTDRIEQLYETRLNEMQDLYERLIATKDKWIRNLFIALISLISVIVLLLIVDVILV